MRKNWQKLKIVNSYYDELKDTDMNYISRRGKNIRLADGKNYTEFLSCSYLGLDTHPEVLKAATSCINDHGISFSSSRRRLKYIGIEQLEEKLNQIYNGYTTVFSSTHLAHLGIIPLLASGELPGFSIPQSPHFVISKTAHSSMQINYGLMEQFGSVSMIDLTNTQELEHYIDEISSSGITPIIMCDSVGSMGGVEDIVYFNQLVNQYNGYLYIDDAHGMSICGINGSGYALSKFNNSLPPRVILISSLAKGFGTYAGVVVFKQKSTLDFVKMYCSTYVFSGSLTTPVINASIAAANIHLSDEVVLLQQKLHANLALFDNLITNPAKISNYQLFFPIRGLRVGDERLTIKIGNYLKEHRILVSVCLYPTVPRSEGLVRFCIASNHSQEEISKLCQLINQQ